MEQEVKTELTRKEKIALVLKESLKAAKKSNFKYVQMFQDHKFIIDIQNLDSDLKERVKRFESLPEESKLFKDINETTKKALKDLQEGKGYEFFSAELILKFHKLESIFKGKTLKSNGTRESVSVPKPEINGKPKVPVVSKEEDGDMLIKPGADGKKLLKQIRFQKQVKSSSLD